MSAIARARALGIAEAQLGLVTRAQLAACGLSTDQIKRLIASGFLVVVHRSVYRVAGSPDQGLAQPSLAACLACGADSVVSHRTALALRRLVDPVDGWIDVVVPPSRHPAHNGIRVHRSTVSSDEKTFLGSIPVTTVERTIVDVAGQFPARELEELVDRAFRARWTTPPSLDSYLTSRASAGRPPPGSAALRVIVDDRLGRGVPESLLEAKMIGLLRRARLPEAERQFETVVAGRRVRFDLAYPDARVAIELEGRAPHWGRERWQSDHRRDNSTELGGWRKLGFTWWDVTNDELYVAITVGEALGLRPRSWRCSS